MGGLSTVAEESREGLNLVNRVHLCARMRISVKINPGGVELWCGIVRPLRGREGGGDACPGT